MRGVYNEPVLFGDSVQEFTSDINPSHDDARHSDKYAGRDDSSLNHIRDFVVRIHGCRETVCKKNHIKGKCEFYDMVTAINIHLHFQNNCAEVTEGMFYDWKIGIKRKTEIKS